MCPALLTAAVFDAAFALAHDASRAALVESEPDVEVVHGVPMAGDEWAIDGGTTATIIALLDGATLVHAQVGDSSALLGGTIGEDGGDEAGEVTFEELMEEHSASNAAEYERVLTSGPRGKMMRFVYDVPDLIDQGKPPPIFKKGPGGYELNTGSRRIAEVHGVPPKNARGELPMILLTPDEDKEYGDMEAQSLAMTRSIGDFYMHTFGVTWKPEVISVELEEVGEKLEHLTLILASDGIWDLYEYEDVFQGIASPPTAAGQNLESALTFFQKSVKVGEDMFDNTADNMTGIVVYFNPKGTKVIEAKPGAKGGSKPAAPPQRA